MKIEFNLNDVVDYLVVAFSWLVPVAVGGVLVGLVFIFLEVVVSSHLKYIFDTWKIKKLWKMYLKILFLECRYDFLVKGLEPCGRGSFFDYPIFWLNKRKLRKHKKFVERYNLLYDKVTWDEGSTIKMFMPPKK